MPIKIPPLNVKIDPMKCMGNWYVQVAIPTPFDRNATNGLEEYTWDEKKQRVRVKYTFNAGSFTGKLNTVYQLGRTNPKSDNGTRWQVAPWIGLCYLPSWLDYHIIGIDAEDYSHMVACSPTTGGMAPWMYIMTRDKVVTDEFLEPLKKIAGDAGWDMTKSERVLQQPLAQS
jgi:lipocalin